MSGVPGPVNRILTLFLGPAYCWLLAVIMSNQTGGPLYVSLIQVFVSGLVLVGVVIALSVKFVDAEKSGKNRWSIQTMVLLTAVVGILMGYLAPFVAEFNRSGLSAEDAGGFVLGTLVFLIVSVIVSVRFAESLIQLLLSFFKLLRPKQTRDG